MVEVLAVLLYRYLASRTITDAGFATTSTDAARAVLLSVTVSNRPHEVREPASCSFTAALPCILLRCRLCFFACPTRVTHFTAA